MQTRIWQLGFWFAAVACSRETAVPSSLGRAPTADSREEGDVAPHAAASPPPANALARTPVLVELFSSEGCSSCPAAEQVLGELSRNPPDGVMVVPLEFHVDYWDYIGHVDPFASAAFTERQRNYARRFRTSSVYTPQAVVDGKTELVGSRLDELTHAIKKAAADVHASIAFREGGTSGKLELVAGPLGNGADVRHVFLATVARNPKTVVTHGENAGKTLIHSWVVTRLFPLGDVPPAGATLDVPATARTTGASSGLVAFANRGSDGKIVGAAVRWQPN